MTSNDMPQDDQRQTTVEAGAGAAQDAAPAGHGAESATVDPVAEALALLTAERDELKDRMLRTLAEMENLRRRTEREIADARAYAVTNFARDVLNVADNIRRALDSVPADARATADGALKGLIDGIDLTERDLAKTLERHGVKIVEPQGQKFDPNRHQAMFEVPNTEVPSGTVVQVVQAGYVIGERVLRPALVGVAKGGPKAANPADAA
jgi:molecular chaperone GrpE